MFSINFSKSTEGQTEVNYIRWTFPNFTKLLEKRTREFRTVQAIGHEKRLFQLKMLLLGRSNELIEIYYLSRSSVFLKTDLAISHNRNEERSINIVDFRTIQANKWQYLATFYKRDMNRDAFLHYDGSFRLLFKFMISRDVTIDRHNIPAPRLSDDFKNLLTDGSYSDATMKSVEGEEFKVHKPILAIRSEVLKAHFEHKTTESITSIIDTQMETEVLHEILTFIYTDKAPRVDEIPEKLLAAADYYQLGRLKSLCEEALHKRLTVENAIETLRLAELHSAQSLGQSTLEFIKDGQAQLITKTPDWEKVQNVELIKRIYEFIMADDVIEADIR